MIIRFINSIHQIPLTEWNNLCPNDYPFVRHEFLAALEDTKCTDATAGWQPQHMVVHVGDKIVAAMPLYIKTHSYGEYVFDWAWADAYKRFGRLYYPKLICAVPFTPCYGSRLLIRDEKEPIYWPEIISSLSKLCIINNWSGWHCLFPNKVQSDTLDSSQIVQRLGCQFHWFNRGYKSWEEFTLSLNSRKRKNMLKERRHINEQGFSFLIKEGKGITPEDWDMFFALYRNTYLKRSGHGGYLTREFFHRVGELMPDNLMLISAFKDGNDSSQAVAASLYFRDAQTLYGRYWGCIEEYKFLHFETCYYQGINYAINNGLQRFDGGAQGEHKISRGFEPVVTYSNHWIVDEQFRAAITVFIKDEAKGIQHYINEAKSLLPFKALDD